MANKTRTTNVNSSIIPGCLTSSANFNFDGDTVAIATVMTGKKFVSVSPSKDKKNRDVLNSIAAGVMVNSPDGIVVRDTANKFTRFGYGAVVVFIGDKIFWWSQKSVEILVAYEAAKAYYAFVSDYASCNATQSMLSIEEKSIAWLAEYCSNLGYWRSSVFKVLTKYDKSLRKYQKVYYKHHVKENKRTDALAEDIEKIDNALEDLFSDAPELVIE